MGVACFGTPPAARADPPPTIVVHPGDRVAHRIAVQRFADKVGTRAGELRTAIEAAIAFTPSTRPLDEAAFLGPVTTERLHDRTRTDCADWRTGGAEVLVEGVFGDGRAGRVRIEVGVWDVSRCVRLLRRVYTQPAASLPRLALRIADDVVGAVTGVRGAASTEIAFISTRTGRREVMVMDASGAHARAATHSDAVKAFPEWLPGGGGVLYTAYVTGLQPGLYVAARRNDVRAGAFLPRLFPDRPKYRGVFDPSGETLAFVSPVDGSAEIYSVARNGRGLDRLTHSPSIEVAPAWSPDGEWIAFVSDRSGSPQIFVMRRDGSDKRRLTFQGSYNTAPRLSPDGNWLAYQSRIGAQFDIWLIDATGRANFPIVEHPRSDEWPSWSPDGRRIVFSSTRRGRADLYTVDRSGRNLERLTRAAGDNLQPVWGPWPD